LAEKVDHGLEEILIFEYEFRITVAEEYSHINITDLLAFISQLTGLITHQAVPFEAVIDHNLLVLMGILFYQHHIFIYFAEKLFE